MRHYCDNWIQEWCSENGWTDLSKQRYEQYWAFPPGAVIPEPIPANVLQRIKEVKGFCLEEKLWLSSALILSSVAVILSYLLQSPMPIVLAFAWDALTVAGLEVEA